MCFLLFNVFNYLGSTICSFLRWPRGASKKIQLTVCALAFLRLGFVPLFMMCNLAPENRSMNVSN